MSEATLHPRRLLWIVNHKALLPAEVPILCELGWEVFIPKIIPRYEDYRSGVVSFDYDAGLTIPKASLEILNATDFYGTTPGSQSWSPAVAKAVNRHFDVLVTTVSAFTAPLVESVRRFLGTVIARVFGLEHPQSYANVLKVLGHPELLDEIAARRSGFVFAQAYANLAEIEPPALAQRAHTITVPLPPSIYDHAGSWRGTGDAAVFLCPAILQEGGYYKDIYDGIKRDFGDLPHKIFGRQIQEMSDPAVLPYLSDDALIDLYAEAPVFIYPSTEARHIHYSPVEAMVVGTPVLYRRGSLADILADHADLAGACATTEEMHGKAMRLLEGDSDLATDIRAGQHRIVETFRRDLVKEQWRAVLEGAALRPGGGAWRPWSGGARRPWLPQ
jgi:hypothetical protein